MRKTIYRFTHELAICLVVIQFISCREKNKSGDVSDAGSGRLRQRSTAQSKGHDPTLEGLRKNESRLAAQLDAAASLSTQKILDRLQSIAASGKTDTATIEEYSIILDELARKDPGKAFDIIKGGLLFNAPGLKERLFEQIIQTLPSSELAALFGDWAKSTQKSEYLGDAQLCLLESLGRSSKAKDLTGIISSIFNGPYKYGAIPRFFESLGAAQPGEVINILNSLSLGKKEMNMANMAVSFSCRDSDPHAAFLLLGSVDRSMVGTTYGAVLTSWLRQDRSSALNAIRTLDASGLQSALSEPFFVKEIAATENDAAIKDMVNGIPFTDVTAANIASLIKKYSSVNLQSSLNIVNTLPESSAKSNLAEEIFRSIDFHSVSDAQKSLATVPAGMKSSAFLGAGQKLIESGVGDPILFIASAPGDVQSKLSQELINYRSQSDPQAAATLLATFSQNSTMNPQEVTVAASSLAKNWANSSLSEVVAWSSTLNDGKLKAGAIAGIAETWTSTDIVAATGWINEMQSGDARDAAVSVLIGRIRNTDPESAKEWEKTLQKNQAR